MIISLYTNVRDRVRLLYVLSLTIGNVDQVKGHTGYFFFSKSNEEKNIWKNSPNDFYSDVEHIEVEGVFPHLVSLSDTNKNDEEHQIWELWEG